MPARIAACIVFCVALLSGALAEADPATLDRIVAEGKQHSQVMAHLEHLAKRIGPRLTASPQLDRAYQWTMSRFREFGCKNVRLEQWGEWPLGFERGRTQTGRMIAPVNRQFEFTTRAWTSGTRGAVRGIAIRAPLTKTDLLAARPLLKGAWIISADTEAVPEDGVVDAVNAAGIAGRVFAASGERLITSGRWDVKMNDVSPITRVTVRRSDMDAILSKLDLRERVILEFNIDNRFVRGPRKNYNVIADILGTEKPDEMVIVGGHLDSWDGPGSEGAQDNGTGISVALEAARILGRARARPKRTIRFVLWTGEEQGLHGSRAYVEKHRAELGKISAVFVEDGGTNYQGGLDCTAEMEPILKKALETAAKAFPELPVTTRVVRQIPRSGDSDHHPFNVAGVPGFFWRETGRGDYSYVHHTQNDRLEAVIPEYLVQSAVNTAAVAYAIACEQELLPREQPTN